MRGIAEDGWLSTTTTAATPRTRRSSANLRRRPRRRPHPDQVSLSRAAIPASSTSKARPRRRSECRRHLGGGRHRHHPPAGGPPADSAARGIGPGEYSASQKEGLKDLRFFSSSMIATADETFAGVKPVEERHRFDEAALDAWLRANVEGYAGPLRCSQFKGGPVEPDLPARHAERGAYVLRAQAVRASCCPRRTRSTASSGSSRRCTDAGFPVARPYGLCTDEARRSARMFYVMEMVEGRIFWDRDAAASCSAGRAPRDLRGHDRDARAPCTAPIRRDRARRLRQARQLFRAPVRPLDRAVPRLGDRDRSRDGPADRLAAGAPCPPAGPAPPSSMATTGSTT